jgi:hypothetical protein
MNLKSLAKTLCFGGCRSVGKPRSRQDGAFWRDTSRQDSAFWRDTSRQDGAFWRDTSRAEEEQEHILRYFLFLNKLILQSANILIL